MKLYLLLAIVMTQTPTQVVTHDYVVDHGLTYEDCQKALYVHKAQAEPLIEDNVRVSTTFACTSGS